MTAAFMLQKQMEGYALEKERQSEYAIEMLHITKKFPGIIANDDITLQLRHGEIHALLGENGDVRCYGQIH